MTARVLWRWFLYTFVGALFLFFLLAGGGDAHGGDEPKGSWRSILLSFAGMVSGVGGLVFLLARNTEGGLADAWPAGSVIAWSIAVVVVVCAWFSIAEDIRREGGKKKAR